ncbi:VanZ family protein [Streptococcus merionis]|uniref:VanZ family protein n=1 Tax=Streptococcus merionis TaxID=400065 RepID=UPI0026EBBE25|nr:VanZ family protein [Streptococcus merionis]
MKAKKTPMTILVLLIYLLVLTWLIVFKLATAPYELSPLRSINLIPFAENQDWDGSFHFKEVLANGLVFIPLGVLLKRLSPKRNLLQVALYGLSLSFVFEASQYLLAIGASDVTDLLANTVGAIVGSLLFSGFSKLFKKSLGVVLDWLIVLGSVLLVLLVLWLKSRGIWIWHFV